MDVASKILRALDDAHLPPTYGFVSGVRIEEHPAAAVLDAWRASGGPLGNHGWSHMNLDQDALEEFEADVNRNEPLLSSRMKDRTGTGCGSRSSPKAIRRKRGPAFGASFRSTVTKSPGSR